MAILNNSIIASQLSGLLGEEVVFRQWDGQTIVAKAPKARTKPYSPEELQRQENFALANKYAREILKDEQMKAGYTAALRPRQHAINRAVQDFMISPEVKNIDASRYTGMAGSSVSVRAIDDFRVISVKVEIFTASDTLLEQGSATVQENSFDWIYAATQTNSTLAGTKIRATATDNPGNEGTLEITL